MSGTNVCLQINMAALDIRHVPQTLPHQLRMLGGQVDEIQFTLDTHQSRASRYAVGNYAEARAELRRYLESVCADFPQASVVDVDYSAAAMAEVARAFIGGDFIPKKAENGSPFYPYLYGLFRARSDYVFHMDSDILYGGGSPCWIAEAVAMLERNRDVLACNPLAGPPRADGRLTTQTAASSDFERFRHSFDTISTRVFILDRRRFLNGDDKIPLMPPKGLMLLSSFINNTPPYLALEDCMTALMRAKGLRRVDFLGSGQGMWSVHPAFRSDRFYRELPHLIQRIEVNDIPDAQRGDYNLNDSMIDWSDVRRRTTAWTRVQRRLRFAVSGISERVLGGRGA